MPKSIPLTRPVTGHQTPAIGEVVLAFVQEKSYAQDETSAVLSTSSALGTNTPLHTYFLQPPPLRRTIRGVGGRLVAINATGLPLVVHWQLMRWCALKRTVQSDSDRAVVMPCRVFANDARRYWCGV